MKIAIDAGHGGPASGAVGPSKTLEKNINLIVALKLEQLLKEAGYQVIMTRRTDAAVAPGKTDGEELSTRCLIANKAKADLFISIHCNALDATTKGIETWYHNWKSPLGKDNIAFSRRYATLLYDELNKTFPGHIKRGVQPDSKRYPKTGFGVLRRLEMPGALVELEFLSHPEMEKLLNDPKVQDGIARALFNATKQYLG